MERAAGLDLLTGRASSKLVVRIEPLVFAAASIWAVWSRAPPRPWPRNASRRSRRSASPFPPRQRPPPRRLSGRRAARGGSRATGGGVRGDRLRGHEGGRSTGIAYFDANRVRTLAEVLIVVVDLDDRMRRVGLVRFAEPPEYSPPDGWLASSRACARRAARARQGRAAHERRDAHLGGRDGRSAPGARPPRGHRPVRGAAR